MERAYLRAKAIWLSMVLDPPERKPNGGDPHHRVKSEEVRGAYMDFENLAEEHRG